MTYQEIIDMLKKLAEIREEYPADLLALRQAAFAEQLKTAAPLCKAGTAGSRQNGNTVKAA